MSDLAPIAFTGHRVFVSRRSETTNDTASSGRQSQADNYEWSYRDAEQDDRKDDGFESSWKRAGQKQVGHNGLRLDGLLILMPER